MEVIALCTRESIVVIIRLIATVVGKFSLNQATTK